MLSKLAIRNVKRSFKDYAIYLITITLAFAFISIFCNEFIAEDLKQSKEKIKYEIIHSNYYLDIIKKISMYQKNNNANEDKEFNDNEK